MYNMQDKINIETLRKTRNNEKDGKITKSDSSDRRNGYSYVL